MKFQESELEDPAKRKMLGTLARPRTCPYCGGKECMTVHQWVPRYLVLGASRSVNLLVPVYKCKDCRHHIRVLPRQCHVYHQYSSALILSALRLWCRRGRNVRAGWLDQSLVRRWVRMFLESVRSLAPLLAREARKALDEIPRFSILFRSDVKTMGMGEDAGVFRGTQRPFTLAVCLCRL